MPFLPLPPLRSAPVPFLLFTFHPHLSIFSLSPFLFYFCIYSFLFGHLTLLLFTLLLSTKHFILSSSPFYRSFFLHLLYSPLSSSFRPSISYFYLHFFVLSSICFIRLFLPPFDRAFHIFTSPFPRSVFLYLPYSPFPLPVFLYRTFSSLVHFYHPSPFLFLPVSV